MRFGIRTVFIIVLLGCSAPSQAEGGEAALVLDGRSLSPAELVRAARLGRHVDVTDEASARVRDSAAVLIKAAESCQKIYGLTTGVGANKDQTELDCKALLDDSGGLSEATIEASREFNRELLHAHAAGVGEALPAEVVRAILIARLNTALAGGTGMHDDLVRRLETYIDRDILPVIPERGSLGEADITLLAHIGLTTIGEWQVDHRGERVAAREALAVEGLAPLAPWGKDALASFSSNAYSAALAAFALSELRHVSAVARLVYALSLEGLNGNVAPFLPEPLAMRPYPHVQQAAADLRAITAGSYLYAPSEKRPLQDPLSYRTAVYQIGTLDRTLAELDEVLTIQLNAADDNPVVYLGEVAPVTAAMPEIEVVATDGLSGAVIPSANFTPLPLVVAMQSAAIAAAHVSQGSALRTIKLVDPEISHLSRFLGTEHTVHAFGAIQKPFVALAAENRELANPVSPDFLPVALDVEDMATNAPRVARRLRRMADNLIGILSFELMHAAQAVDLRRRADPGLALSPITGRFHDEYRRHVAFLERDDRILSRDIAATMAFLRGCRLAAGERVDWSRWSEADPICTETP